MGWDNVQLNVNGKKDTDLAAMLRLVFSMHAPQGAEAYIKDREKGLILLWYGGYDKASQQFPTRLDAEQVFHVVKAYLESEDAKQVSLPEGGWDGDCDHDGSNSVGWRVYAEDWGHVKTHYAICAVKRVLLWHGK